MPTTLECCIGLIGLLTLASAITTGDQLMERISRSTTTDEGRSGNVTKPCPTALIDVRLKDCQDIRQHVCSTVQDIAIKAIYDVVSTARCLHSTLMSSKPSVNLTGWTGLYKFYINDTFRGNLTSYTYAKMLRNVRPFFDLLHPIEKNQTNLIVESKFLKLRLREFVNSLEIMIECDENMARTDGVAKVIPENVLSNITADAEKANKINRQFKPPGSLHTETPQVEISHMVNVAIMTDLHRRTDAIRFFLRPKLCLKTAKKQ